MFKSENNKSIVPMTVSSYHSRCNQKINNMTSHRIAASMTSKSLRPHFTKRMGVNRFKSGRDINHSIVLNAVSPICGNSVLINKKGGLDGHNKIKHLPTSMTLVEF
jgi:hypothetical protein